MEALNHFPKEYVTCFQASFFLLSKFNIRYFVDDESFLNKYWRFFYILPMAFTFIVSSLIHMVILLMNKQMTDLAYLLPPFLVAVHASLKSLVIIPQSSEITAIIRELGELWRTTFTDAQNEERNTQLKTINFSNNAIYWVSILGTFQYLSSPLLETLVRRYILKQDCELLLPIASSYPFDPTANWFTYIAVYAFQFYTMFTLVCVYSGSQLVMVTMCALLGTEFTMFTEDLSSIKPILDGNMDEDSSIKAFVERHQKLIRLSRQLDEVFNRLVFVDLLFVGITTCAFRFAGEFARGPTYTINNYVAVVSSMSTVLYLCYHGERLTRASAGVGDLAYQGQWYRASTKYKKFIFLIIIISQKPCCMTSLKYTIVSLNLFTKVVSTTWSYFSLLNSVYRDEELEDTTQY